MDAGVSALIAASTVALKDNVFGVLQLVVPVAIVIAVAYMGVRWILKRAHGA